MIFIYWIIHIKHKKSEANVSAKENEPASDIDGSEGSKHGEEKSWDSGPKCHAREPGIRSPALHFSLTIPIFLLLSDSSNYRKVKKPKLFFFSFFEFWIFDELGDDFEWIRYSAADLLLNWISIRMSQQKQREREYWLLSCFLWGLLIIDFWVSVPVSKVPNLFVFLRKKKKIVLYNILVI